MDSRRLAVWPASWALLVVCVACSGGDPPAGSMRQATSTDPVGPFQPFASPSPSTGGSGGSPGAGGSGGSVSASAGTEASGGSGGGAGEDEVAEGPAPLLVCDDDDAGVAADDDAGPGPGCLVTGDLVVQYRAADTNALDNQIKPHFNLINTGSETVPLEDLTLRYWFTDPGDTPPLVFWCDYAQIGCGSVSGSFLAVERDEADHVLEVGFTGGTLAAGSETGEIQARFNREDWRELDEGDDYSFDASVTSFADAPHVTLYLRGVQIWGVEPP